MAVEFDKSKVLAIGGGGGSTEDYTTADKNKLAGIEPGAQVNTVTSVAGKTGDVALDKGDVGLGNVNNTSDVDKPVSTATATALDTKVDKLSVGSAPNELPSNQHLGAIAFLDALGATQVTQHTRDSQPGNVWHEYVSDTQLVKKFHGFDNVIRTITETYA